MNTLQTLTIIASAITAVGGVLITCYKFVRNAEKRYEAIEHKFEHVNETLRVNTIHLLKIAVLDENLPLTDRIYAGEQYIKLGGNGFIKKKYEKLLEEYEKRYGGN